MEFSIEKIIFLLVLIDAVGANFAAWTPLGTTLNKKYPIFGTFLPITKGWTTYYFILVCWVGYALFRLGVLS